MWKNDNVRCVFGLLEKKKKKRVLYPILRVFFTYIKSTWGLHSMVFIVIFHKSCVLYKLVPVSWHALSPDQTRIKVRDVRACA